MRAENGGRVKVCKLSDSPLNPEFVPDKSHLKKYDAVGNGCNKADTLDDEDITVVEVRQSTILVPPDGGWGWFVVLGCFLMNLIVNGISYSFGVIFMELMANYERTLADISWVYSLNCVTCSWLGPFATALSNAFSFRTIVIVGGFIYSVGIIASSFVTKLEWLYVTYGLISGIGSALVYGPSIIMVGRYFDKRRSLANGLAVSGSGVGSFLIPPILHFLFDQYTIKGCILILGAFSFHLCVAGLLYRPVPLKRVRQKPQPVLLLEDHEPAEANVLIIRIHPASHSGTPNGNMSKVPSRASIKEEMFETVLYPTRGAGGFVMGTSLLSIPENIVTVQQHLGARLRHVSGEGILRHLRRAALFLYAWPRRLRSGVDLSSLFDFSLLKDRLFLTFTTSVMMASFGYLSVYLIVSSHALDLNFAKAEAVSLVSIMGICDLVGRISFGWFSDFQFIPRRWGFCFMIVLAALGNFLVVFATQYVHLAVFAGCFGLFGGSFMVMNAVLTADLFGLERLPSAIGLLITIQGIAFLVGPPIIGAIRDQAGSFDPAFLVIGVVMSVGACLLPMETLVTRFLRKRRRLSGNSTNSDETAVLALPEISQHRISTKRDAT